MTTQNTLTADQINTASQAAGQAIPPVWPLAATVAVNPFLGQSGEPLATTAARLGRIGGVAVTQPRSWYKAKINAGTLTDADLEAALAAQDAPAINSLAQLKQMAWTDVPAPAPVPTVADLAAGVSGTDWPALIAERFGHWAAGFFDQGQALWAAPQRRGAYDAWRQWACHDLTPEIAGLKGFAQTVLNAPDTAEAALAQAVERLGLSEDMLETYLHQLLFTLGGWAQVARYRLWQAELAEGTDSTLSDLLTIRILWEDALLGQYGDQISEGWAEAKAVHAAPVAADADAQANAVLQLAWEHAVQRDLAETLAETPAAAPSEDRPALQAAFCIDVRSEVFRRALEGINPGIQTLGFAGFFGLTAAHRDFASDVEEKRLPVLLNAGVSSTVEGAGGVADQAARLKARAVRAWGRFKLAAVSSFAFVEATGPIYAGKLVRDALNLAPAAVPGGPAPRLDPALDHTAQVDAAETILRAMSFTDNFARMVILAGHGANVVNNPFASSLHCGACGGYSGEVNARLLAGLLNTSAVRDDLRGRGIDIPADTVFVPALHDTTTDQVVLYDGDCDMSGHASDLAQARDWCAAAGAVCRGERALRLPGAADGKDVAKRSRDWAETRPEWALAGCKAFIAAPRRATSGKDLQGRAFLHDYVWQNDAEFGVLELIMTAPVVVASWISLQYYGSSVAPEVFGSGNKLLHNVTGGMGVVEGNGGTLRTGLPWQSVHDGDGLAHDPLRLSVCIQAPREAMTDVLRRHDGVRALFDNGWLHLFALDEEGQIAWRYGGDLTWKAYGDALQAAPALAEAS